MMWINKTPKVPTERFISSLNSEKSLISDHIKEKYGSDVDWNISNETTNAGKHNARLHLQAAKMSEESNTDVTGKC